MAETEERIEEIEANLRSTEQERSEAQERMEALRADVEEVALANWQSPWKTPQSVEVFVKARMKSRPEYAPLLAQVREAETRKEQLQGELDALRAKADATEGGIV
ncbi:MAG: hypothetical protein ACRDJF_01630 [Actinomycetota bacterium]